MDRLAILSGRRGRRPESVPARSSGAETVAGRGRGPSQLVKVAAAMFCAGLALNGVIPLFPLYQARFGLSTTDLTLIFAIYAFTLVPALLLMGPLSDRIGRKRVLVPALLTFVVASIAFSMAQGLWTLLAGRVLQGLANGAMWGTAAAMIRDLMPDDRRADASLVVSVTLTASIATGVIYFGVVGAVTQSFVIPWLGHAVLIFLAALVVLTVPETVAERTVGRLRVGVSLPSGHERAFTLFLAPLTLSMVSLGGIVMALTPSIIADLSSRSVSAVSGLSLAIFVSISTVVQLVTRRVTAFRATVAGAFISASGAGLVLVAISVQSMPAVLSGMAVLGTGMGLSFRGTLAMAEYMSHVGNRASVISAYNVVMYAGMSVPTLAAGVLADRAGVWWALLIPTAVSLALAIPASLYGVRRLAPSLRV